MRKRIQKVMWHAVDCGQAARHLSFILLVSSVSVGACQKESPDRPSDEVESASEHADGGSSTPEVDTGSSDATSENSDAGLESTTEIADWGVKVFVPPDAWSGYQPEANRFRIVIINPEVSVEIYRHDEPAPTPAELDGRWDGGRDAQKLDDGTSPDGIIYGVRSRVVRVGMPGGGGRSRHRLQEVGRVHAILPMGESHIRCTGFVEHAVDKSDPNLQLVKRICLSLRLD